MFSLPLAIKDIYILKVYVYVFMYYMCEGFSPEEALKKEVNLEAATKKSTERKVRLDTGTLKNLKHDVNALKQIADLRQKTQVTAIGWQGGVLAERREGEQSNCTKTHSCMFIHTHIIIQCLNIYNCNKM